MVTNAAAIAITAAVVGQRLGRGAAYCGGAPRKLTLKPHILKSGSLESQMNIPAEFGKTFR